MALQPLELVRRHRLSIRQAVALHRVSNLRVFGTVSPDRAPQNGGLEFVVDRLGGTTLQDLAELQAELEALLGVAVTVVTPSDFPARARAAMLTAAVAV